jgi:ElaB/YqjD/DUF883 family membrane-anchored ribosome-binding protein
MNAPHELAEQSSDKMREEIDCTRFDLAGKLEALEDQVMGTVQSAQETVEDSIQMAKDTVATVKRTFDIKHHIEQHPWVAVGGCFLAGLALSALFPRVYRRPRQTLDRPAGKPTAFPTSPALSAEQRGDGSFAGAAPQSQDQAAAPSRPGMLDLFDDEIDKVKGMAIGYVMGLVRDSIKDTVPQLASQIDDVMNSVATKLGSTPVQQRST